MDIFQSEVQPCVLLQRKQLMSFTISEQLRLKYYSINTALLLLQLYWYINQKFAQLCSATDKNSEY